METIVDMNSVNITISVVSHGQMDLITLLMRDVQMHCQGLRLELILTLNIGESITFEEKDFFYPIRIIQNAIPKGFGANHNQAFLVAQGDYFCVVNPDIRLNDCPFSELISCLSDPKVGVVAPLVFGASGELEDSARHFPTPLKILHKAFKKSRCSDYIMGNECMAVDWVGGMFMVFPSGVFKKLRGFDETYFLYYEDVDICARLCLLDLRAMVNPGARVVHHAQRSSHRHMKYLRWHLSSMLRFFTSSIFWRLKRLHRI